MGFLIGIIAGCLFIVSVPAMFLAGLTYAIFFCLKFVPGRVGMFARSDASFAIVGIVGLLAGIAGFIYVAFRTGLF